MATRAAGMMFHCVFEGSLSMSQMDKEQRPYHKDCSCALHKAKDETPRACIHHGRISYSKKPSWNKCSLTKTVSSSSVQSSSHSGQQNGKTTKPLLWRHQSNIEICWCLCCLGGLHHLSYDDFLDVENY